MKIIYAAVLGVSLMATACTADTSVNPWQGEYQFSGLGGETAGGSPIMMEITLTINSPGSGNPCLFHAVGFQTLETIFCSTSVGGRKLDIKFKSYDDGRILNGYDVARYKVGEVLFSLEKEKGKDNITRYITHWASYVPFDNMNIGGKYVFMKTKYPL